MAAVTTVLAGVGAFLAVDNYIKSDDARKEAKKNAENAAGEQRKSQAEQLAGNAAQQAAERRRQVREERVRRARLLQASENSGTTGSSGETGGIGSLATQFGSNLGLNAGAANRAQNITAFNQTAADFSFASQQSQADAQSFQQLSNLGMSIFSGAGGFSNFKSSTPQLVDSTQIPMQPGGGY